MTPTQRTLKALKGKGLTCGIVERWLPIPGIPGGGKRQDLFNILDIIAIAPGRTIGVQSCGQSFAAHLKTLTEDRAEESRAWIEAGNELELWGWRKLKAKKQDGSYGKAMRWAPRVRVITLKEVDTKSNA